MHEIRLELDNNQKGAFVVKANNVLLAEMAVSINNGNLTVYHTEVSSALQGKGVGGELLATMVDYARNNHLKVIPLCPYVYAQFKRHSKKYEDIWNKKWHERKI